MIRIRDWGRFYEPTVREQGRDTEGPLKYVKSRNYGGKISSGMLRLSDAAPDGHMEAFGVFERIKEMAGAQPRGVRDGVVRDDAGRPATLEWIARRVMLDVRRLAASVAALAIAEWIDVDAVEARRLEDLIDANRGKIPTLHGDDDDPQRGCEACAQRHENGSQRKPKPKHELKQEPKPKGDPDPATGDGRNGGPCGEPRDPPQTARDPSPSGPAGVSASGLLRNGHSASVFEGKAVALGQFGLGQIDRFHRALTAPGRQGDADRTCRDAMLRRLAAGCTSQTELQDRIDRMLAKARNIARGTGTRNPMAALTGWFKRAHGGWP